MSTSAKNAQVLFHYDLVNVICISHFHSSPSTGLLWSLIFSVISTLMSHLLLLLLLEKENTIKYVP